MFLCNETTTPEIYTYVTTLSLHDALPICGGDADHHQRRPQRGEGAGVAGWQLGVEAREREDDRDLHQLRWLEVDDAEVEPALAAAPDETEQFDADEKDDHPDIGDIGEILAQPEIGRETRRERV